MLHPGFDNAKYLEEQTREILVSGTFQSKLYLEFGELFTTTTLPGFCRAMIPMSGQTAA